MRYNKSVQDITPSKKGKTVRIDWKLPSRLQKPFRAKRKKHAQKEAQPASSLHFHKKSIATPKVWNIKQVKKDIEHSISLPSHRFFGNEPQGHTADVVSAPPKVTLMPPPYRGTLAGTRKSPKKSVAHAVPPKVLSARVQKIRSARPARAIPHALRPKKVEPVPIVTPPQIFTERDVAYNFFESSPVDDRDVSHLRAEETEVVPPRPIVSLPVSFSVSAISPSRAMAIIFLLIGFALTSFIVWNLQGAGRGTAALATIEAKAARAFAHVGSAQAALASTDVLESEKQFAAASQELTSAKADMDNALAASKNILQFLDVTGTVQAGQNMLEVGTLLADAGVHMSRAIEPFLSVTLETPLVDAIVSAKPEMESARDSLASAEEKLQDIETSFMPENIASEIKTLQAIVPKAKSTLDHLTQESGTMLALLGAERDRQYLLLFANSDELRPVGGFIGTVGLINVGKGKVENIDVRSVYDGDGQLKKFLAPPNPLLPITNRWFLRDSNWFVDYRTNAKKAAQLFEKEGGPTVDGVIMMTPKVIENLLRVTGPISVPGYSIAVTADNFKEVTQGEVTYNYDRTVNKPKQFLSDLTPLLLTRLFATSPTDGSRNGKLQTLHALTQSLFEKDLLLYFADEKAQDQVTALGWGGAVPEKAEGFLMVNNANIGGHKSDQFIEQEIDYRTTLSESGDADVVVTVRRTHRGPEEKIAYPYPAGEDPSAKANIVYQRTLVPKGAKLIEAKGFTPESDVPRPVLADASLQLEADPEVVAWQQNQYRMPDGTTVGTESGYTFFANWVVTKPGQTSVTLYHYTIPKAAAMPSLFHRAASYSLGVAKQPGQQRTTIRASITVPEKFTIIDAVPKSGVTLESRTNYVYRGELTSDIVPGIVFET